MDLDLLVDCYKAMADKTRLKILALLREKELCVCELVELIHMTQPAVSQHLRKMKQAKLLKERKQGQWIYYSLDGSLFPFFDANVEALPDMKAEIEKLESSGNVCC